MAHREKTKATKKTIKTGGSLSGTIGINRRIAGDYSSTHF
jgi:hypothetical protein